MSTVDSMSAHSPQDVAAKPGKRSAHFHVRENAAAGCRPASWTSSLGAICDGSRCRRGDGDAESLCRCASQVATRIPQLRREYHSRRKGRRFPSRRCLDANRSRAGQSRHRGTFRTGGSTDERRSAHCCRGRGFQPRSATRSLVVGKQLALGSTTSTRRGTRLAGSLAKESAL